MAGGTRETDACSDDEPLCERPVEAVLRRLARAVRFRDEETAEHVERMSGSCALIAKELGWDQSQCAALRAASALHDIGKVGVPDSVLRKRGRLNARERTLVERHAEIGYEILSGSGDDVLELGARVALSHHERIDGIGYPRRLSGTDIPIEGRIAAVADVFDSLIHDRVYRPAFAAEEALDMMRRGRGSQFDTEVFEAFERVLDEVLEISRRYPDGVTLNVSSAGEGVVGSRVVGKLTPREREVVSLLALGLTGEEIATRLFISPETVRTHIRNAMQRIGATTRAHLVMLAIARQEIEHP
ncbi:MAG TPA: HD domain-containing phosphohydrolase [Gaiellaceae bacterium]